MAGALTLTCSLILAPSVWANPNNAPRSARAREKAASLPNNARMDVLVRFHRTPGAAEQALINTVHGSVKRQLRAASRWMSLRVPASRVNALADNPMVDYVGLDEPVSTAMDIARQSSNVAVAPAPESTLDGAGIGVAVVDSGVRPHFDLPTLVYAIDFVGHPNPQVVPGDEGIDPHGHGTHVAGIMAGNGNRSGGRVVGIAPAAPFVSVRVLDGLGRGLTSDVLAGLQWVLDNHHYGIRVVNLSLGHPVVEPAADDPLVGAVEALWDAGVVVVCSAGNRGRDGFVTITSPCNSRKVITVGAANDVRTGDIGDDKIATYSSRGPTGFDLFAKPDLVAPGNRIVSLRSAGSHLDMLLPERRVAGDPANPGVFDYYEMSGTSMAAPIVTGTVALMLQQDPSLTPSTVKARLMMSARKAEFGNPMITGAGYVDVTAALRSTWLAASALSPRGFADEVTGRMGFENTSILWGSDAFALRNLWASSVSWTDPSAIFDATIWTSGEMWPAGETQGNGELWPNGEVWPEGEMWPDSPLWTPAITTPEAAGPVVSEALAAGFRDE